jgi:UDP-N-acetylglucosamine 2-epimerase
MDQMLKDFSIPVDFNLRIMRPDQTLDDIKACLLFATKSLQEASFVPLAMETETKVRIAR